MTIAKRTIAINVVTMKVGHNSGIAGVGLVAGVIVGEGFGVSE